MTEHDTFETKLAIAFGAYANRAPIDVDAVAMASLAASSAVGPTVGAPRFTWPTLGRRQTMVVIVGLLAVALVGAVILAGASKRSPTPRAIFGQFTSTGELPSTTRDRYYQTAAVLRDGRVLVTGMYPDSDLGDTWSYLYDPTTDQWTPTGAGDQVRQLATSVTLRDGRILIVGGWHVDADGNVVVPSVGELYDPETGQFTRTRGAMVTPRYDPTVTLLADGRVLVAGGSGSDFNAAQGQLAAAEIYDPATDTFSATGSMTTPRDLHAATLLSDGRVLITGGATSRDQFATASAEIFDPSTGTFHAVGPMGEARSWHSTATLSDGRVLVAGGSTADGPGADGSPSPWRPVATAELFDPATGTFAPTGSLTTERNHPSATRLPDGQVLVSGGSNDFGSPRTAELYDPGTGRFRDAGSSVTGHADAMSGLLPDGRVLVLGGAEDTSSNGQPEIWSGLGQAAGRPSETAVAPAFIPVDAPALGLRSDATATRLGDGRVLITGGWDAAHPNDGPVAGAVILDPATGRTEAVGDMAVARSRHAAVLLADGRVLVAGGDAMRCSPTTGECTRPVPTAEVFDPGTGRFTSFDTDLGQMSVRSDAAAAAVLLEDGRVFYMSTGQERIARVIDPVTGQSEPADLVPCLRNTTPVRLTDGRSFVQCGDQPSAYVYSGDAKTLTHMMSVGEAWDGAVGLADGRVLVLRDAGDAAIFDPTTEVYTKTGSMLSGADRSWQSFRPDERPFFRSLTLLADGRVLVAGGATPAGSDGWGNTAAEVYDPSTGRFESVGPMHDARSGHTATALDDGRVLLVGGDHRSPDRTDPDPAPAEIFDPSKVPARP